MQILDVGVDKLSRALRYRVQGRVPRWPCALRCSCDIGVVLDISCQPVWIPLTICCQIRIQNNNLADYVRNPSLDQVNSYVRNSG
jgi:hypothetical protein